MPENGYRGKDIIDIAADLIKEHGDKFVSMSDEDRYKEFRAHGLKIELAKLQKDLADFRVGFDNWFSETSLYENGKIDIALEKLRYSDNRLAISFTKDIQESVKISPLIILTFIENAFKHGVINETEKATIALHLESTRNQILFTKF